MLYKVFSFKGHTYHWQEENCSELPWSFTMVRGNHENKKVIIDSEPLIPDRNMVLFSICYLHRKHFKAFPLHSIPASSSFLLLGYHSAGTPRQVTWTIDPAASNACSPLPLSGPSHLIPAAVPPGAPSNLHPCTQIAISPALHPSTLYWSPQ